MEGLSLSQATLCDDCRLEVDANISSSSVKLVRELGDISNTQCARFAIDKKRVVDKFMSLPDFLFNLQSGSYARPVSKEAGVPAEGGRPAIPEQEYCETIGITDEEAAKITDVNQIDAKLTKGRIRKVSGTGGFSAGTKARFIPGIPFKMSFKGTRINAQGTPEAFSNEFSVTSLSLYHPSPVRIDAVQADAILSLNDPSDRAAKYVILIPLKATNNASALSAQFIGKIANFMPVVNEYDPKSGTYASRDIQTGVGWKLANLFTTSQSGTAPTGPSLVKNGFFTWTGQSGFEQYVVSEGGGVKRLGWRPLPGTTAPQYIMLDTPLEINASDLGTITNNLTVTTPGDAIHPVPPSPQMVFHKGSLPPAPDTLSGSTAGGTKCGIGNLCEGMVDYAAQPNWARAQSQLGIARDLLEGDYRQALTDPFESSCPGAKCDPFLQNAKRVGLTMETFTPRVVFTILFNLMIFIAMLVGAYVALNMVGNDYDLGLRNFSEQLGKVMAVWAKSISSGKGSAPSPPPPPPTLQETLASVLPARR